MRRKIGILLAASAVFVLAGVVAFPYLSYYLLTGSFVPIEKIDKLQNPITVTKWMTNGLCLAGGRMVALPGVRELPDRSEALSAVVKRGVEIDAHGHVWGLVDVHHWCGNDPVRKHIAKVDLSDLMIFLRVGESGDSRAAEDYLIAKPGGTFTKWGWRVGEFYAFQFWLAHRSGA